MMGRDRALCPPLYETPYPGMLALICRYWLFGVWGRWSYSRELLTDTYTALIGFGVFYRSVLRLFCCCNSQAVCFKLGYFIVLCFDALGNPDGERNRENK